MHCKKCQELEEELKLSNEKSVLLNSQLSQSEDSTSLLQHQLEDICTRFTEEIKWRNDTIQQHKEEVEEKSATVAYLKQQLHQAQVKLNKGKECPTPRFERTVSTPLALDVSSLAHRPTPPSSRPPSASSAHWRRASHPVRRSQEPSSWAQRLLPTPPAQKPSSPRLPTPPSYQKDPSTPNSKRRYKQLDRKSLEPVKIKQGNASDIVDILPPSEVTTATKSVLPPIPSGATCNSTQPPARTTDVTKQEMDINNRIQKRVLLAKSQGLSSAPSTLRVLKNLGSSAAKELDCSEGEETVVGTLLVKENISNKNQAWHEVHQP